MKRKQLTTVAPSSKRQRHTFELFDLPDELIVYVIEQLLGDILLNFGEEEVHIEAWQREQQLLLLSKCCKKIHELSIEAFRRFVLRKLLHFLPDKALTLLSSIHDFTFLVSLAHLQRYVASGHYSRANASLGSFLGCCLHNVQNLSSYYCRQLFYSVCYLNTFLESKYFLNADQRTSMLLAFMTAHRMSYALNFVTCTISKFDNALFAVSMKKCYLSDIQYILGKDLNFLSQEKIIMLASIACCFRKLDIVLHLLEYRNKNVRVNADNFIYWAAVWNNAELLNKLKDMEFRISDNNSIINFVRSPRMAHVPDYDSENTFAYVILITNRLRSFDLISSYGSYI